MSSPHPTLARADKAFRQHLEHLGTLDPESRLLYALDALDALEELAEEARQLRAGALIDLRLPAAGGGRAGHTWPSIVTLTGRDVTPQAVEQWSRQYRGVPA